MKYLYSVLVLALVLAVVPMIPTQAGIIRGENLTNPGTGGGETDDGDHPWGGDEVIGGGGTTPRTSAQSVSVLTGIPIVDALIYTLMYDVAVSDPSGTSKTPQSGALGASGISIKPSPAVSSTRTRQSSFRKER